MVNFLIQYLNHVDDVHFPLSSELKVGFVISKHKFNCQPEWPFINMTFIFWSIFIFPFILPAIVIIEEVDGKILRSMMSSIVS